LRPVADKFLRLTQQQDDEGEKAGHPDSHLPRLAQGTGLSKQRIPVTGTRQNDR